MKIKKVKPKAKVAKASAQPVKSNLIKQFDCGGFTYYIRRGIGLFRYEVFTIEEGSEQQLENFRLLTEAMKFVMRHARYRHAEANY